MSPWGLVAKEQALEELEQVEEAASALSPSAPPESVVVELKFEPECPDWEAQPEGELAFQKVMPCSKVFEVTKQHQ